MIALGGEALSGSGVLHDAEARWYPTLVATSFSVVGVPARCAFEGGVGPLGPWAFEEERQRLRRGASAPDPPASTGSAGAPWSFGSTTYDRACRAPAGALARRRAAPFPPHLAQRCPPRSPRRRPGEEARLTAFRRDPHQEGCVQEEGAGKGAQGDDDELEELLIVPVRNMILFPSVVLPLMLGRERSVLSVRAAVAEERPIGLLLQHDEQMEEPGQDDLYRVGTVGEIMRYWTNPDGRHQAVCQGVTRFEIVEYVQTDPVLIARVRRVEEVEPATRAIEARFRALKQRAQDVLALSPGMPEDMAQAVDGIESPAMSRTSWRPSSRCPPRRSRRCWRPSTCARVSTSSWSRWPRWRRCSSSRPRSGRTRRRPSTRLSESTTCGNSSGRSSVELGEGDEMLDEIEELRRPHPGALQLPEEAEGRRVVSCGGSSGCPSRSPSTPAHVDGGLHRTPLERGARRTRRTSGAPVRSWTRIITAWRRPLRILEFLAVKKLNPGGRGPRCASPAPWRGGRPRWAAASRAPRGGVRANQPRWRPRRV